MENILPAIVPQPIPTRGTFVRSLSQSHLPNAAKSAAGATPRALPTGGDSLGPVKPNGPTLLTAEVVKQQPHAPGAARTKLPGAPDVKAHPAAGRAKSGDAAKTKTIRADRERDHVVTVSSTNGRKWAQITESVDIGKYQPVHGRRYFTGENKIVPKAVDDAKDMRDAAARKTKLASMGKSNLPGHVAFQRRRAAIQTRTAMFNVFRSALGLEPLAIPGRVKVPNFGGSDSKPTAPTASPQASIGLAILAGKALLPQTPKPRSA